MGARIKVTVANEGTTRAIYATVGSGGSFGSSSLQQEIGLGRPDGISEIEIRWPTREGTIQRFGSVTMDRVYRITEGDAQLHAVATKRIKLGNQQAHHHHEQ